MPVPMSIPRHLPLFPDLRRVDVDASRTSAWYETFEGSTIPTTIIDLDDLGEREAFLEWFNADSTFLPEGSQNRTTSSNQDIPSERRASTSSAESGSSQSSEAPVYRLPKLNAAIWETIDKYGGSVFPKLNWTSPKDAAFIIPQTSSGPLYCTSPADIYLLLASSDFIPHDLDPETAYEGCIDTNALDHEKIKLEIIMRKYEILDPAREFRCFVRNNILIGVSQRDSNYYDHLQKSDTQNRITDSIRAFWEDEIRNAYQGGEDYIFDIHLDPTFSEPLLLDFAPYRPTTDPLLFTYPDLLDIIQPASGIYEERPRLPVLRVIDSPSHPSASRNTPVYGGSMIPMDIQALGAGRNLGEFREVLAEAVAAGFVEDEDV